MLFRAFLYFSKHKKMEMYQFMCEMKTIFYQNLSKHKKKKTPISNNTYAYWIQNY